MIKRRRVVRVQASLPVLIISLCHDGVMIFGYMIYHHVQCSGLAGFCVSLESLSPHAECVGGGGRRFQLWRPPRGSARVQGGGSRESRRMLCSEGSGKRWAACLVWGKISLQRNCEMELLRLNYTLYTWFCSKLFSLVHELLPIYGFLIHVLVNVNTLSRYSILSIQIFIILSDFISDVCFMVFALRKVICYYLCHYSFWRCNNEVNI